MAREGFLALRPEFGENQTEPLLRSYPKRDAEFKANRAIERENADRELSRQITTAVAERRMTKGEAQKLINAHARAIISANGMKAWVGRGRNRRPNVVKIPGEDVRAPEPAQVYVISAPGHPVKIGIAKDPERRLAELQTGSPHRLMIHFTASVSNGRGVERACHMTLSANRLEGEWFDVTPDRAIEVVRLAAGVELAAA